MGEGRDITVTDPQYITSLIVLTQVYERQIINEMSSSIHFLGF